MNTDKKWPPNCSDCGGFFLGGTPYGHSCGCPEKQPLEQTEHPRRFIEKPRMKWFQTEAHYWTLDSDAFCKQCVQYLSLSEHEALVREAKAQVWEEAGKLYISWAFSSDFADSQDGFRAICFSKAQALRRDGGNG